MSRTMYRSPHFGDIEKYTWLTWRDDNHQLTGILINRSSNSYFNILALYQDDIPFTYPREYIYHDHEMKRVEMHRKFHPVCVEYLGKEETNA
jgi:hypothetical protein